MVSENRPAPGDKTAQTNLTSVTRPESPEGSTDGSQPLPQRRTSGHRPGLQMSGTLRPLDLARHSGVSVETLRYYERLGLLEEPPRSSGGHRRYPPETLKRMQLIKSIRRLGYDLSEVAELFATVRVNHRVDDQDEARIQSVLHDMDSWIAALEKIRAALTTNSTAPAGDHAKVPLLSLITGSKK